MRTTKLIACTGLLVAVSVFVESRACAAVITVPQAAPYTMDANTLLLEHFDSSTTGSASGSVTYSNGVFGQSIHLASGSWVGWTLGAPAQGTVEFWGKLTLISNPLPFFVGAGFSQFAYVTMTVNLASSNTVYGWYHNGSGAVTPAVSPSNSASTNTWHHYALTWGAKGMKLFFDGTLIGTNASTSPLNPNTTWWCVGGSAAPGTSWGPNLFVGSIDELRVSNIQREFSPLIFGAAQINWVKAFTLDYQGLTVGSNYQAQVSSDLVTWNDWGSPFTAAEPTYSGTNFQRLTENQLFFRLVQQ